MVVASTGRDQVKIAGQRFDAKPFRIGMVGVKYLDTIETNLGQS